MVWGWISSLGSGFRAGRVHADTAHVSNTASSDRASDSHRRLTFMTRPRKDVGKHGLRDLPQLLYVRLDERGHHAITGRLPGEQLLLRALHLCALIFELLLVLLAFDALRLGVALLLDFPALRLGL